MSKGNRIRAQKAARRPATEDERGFTLLCAQMMVVLENARDDTAAKARAFPPDSPDEIAHLGVAKGLHIALEGFRAAAQGLTAQAVEDAQARALQQAYGAMRL